MDKSQLTAFVDYMIGEHPIGIIGTSVGEVGSAEPIYAPTCPEMRAFVLARLGDNMPVNGWSAISHHDKTHAKALAALLREVADGLDPQ